MLFLMERPTDWVRLRQASGAHPVLLAGDTAETLEGVAEGEFATILLHMPPEAPVYERLTQALLGAGARGLVAPGGSVVCAYTGFGAAGVALPSIFPPGGHLGEFS